MKCPDELTGAGRIRLRCSGGWAASSLLALMVGSGALLGCGSDEAPPQLPEDDVIPQVPVPAANGPKLVATRHRVIVRDRPSPSGKVLGTLRAGGRVSRADKPYSTNHCAGGWYPIRPRGFVCAGQEVSIDTNTAVAKVLSESPSLDKALPYRYGRVSRGAAVAYSNLPTADEQLRAEPKLHTRDTPKVSRLGAGANDVPLDEGNVATSVALLMPTAEGVGPDGYRTTESYFVFAGPQAPPAGLKVGATLVGNHPNAAKTRVLKRNSGVALTGSFMLGEGRAARRFAVLPDGRFLPTDRLKAALGSTWHGLSLPKIGLPVAFSIRRTIRGYALSKGKAERLDKEHEPSEPIALTGRFRTVHSVRYYFTRDDSWVRHKDIIVVPKRSKFPQFAAPHQKWLDISLANQTLVAWIGKKPLYATLISSGEDRLGDPNAGSPSTLRGVFRLRSKHISRNVDSREVKQAYSILEAPWVLDFAPGFAITGSFWSSRFGEATNYHNITLAPIDAHWVWNWTAPDIPAGWHSVNMAKNQSNNTIVYVHK